MIFNIFPWLRKKQEPVPEQTPPVIDVQSPDEGPWVPVAVHPFDVVLRSQDMRQDVELAITGTFASLEDKYAYVQSLANWMNACNELQQKLPLTTGSATTNQTPQDTSSADLPVLEPTALMPGLSSEFAATDRKEPGFDLATETLAPEPKPAVPEAMKVEDSAANNTAEMVAPETKKSAISLGIRTTKQRQAAAARVKQEKAATLELSESAPKPGADLTHGVDASVKASVAEANATVTPPAQKPTSQVTRGAQKQAYGCHCDLEAGQAPDACVWDAGNINYCSLAQSGVRKQDCEYWRPINFFPQSRRAA